MQHTITVMDRTGHSVLELDRQQGLLRELVTLWELDRDTAVTVLRGIAINLAQRQDQPLQANEPLPERTPEPQRTPEPPRLVGDLTYGYRWVGDRWPRAW